ncbi:hypothetical protein ACFQU7_12765 [Pseudoroseomonas wenyumeiae]
MAGLLRRLLALVPVLLGVTLASFLLTRLLPGDPAVFFANSVTADAATVAALRTRMGLDLPLWQQFLAYLAQLARGIWGNPSRPASRWRRICCNACRPRRS